MRFRKRRWSENITSIFVCAGSLLLVAVNLSQLEGCRVQAGNPQADKPKKPGTVTVALADAPVDDLSNLFITVNAIAFAPEGTGRCISEPERRCADSSLFNYELNKDLEVDLLSLSDGRTQVLPFAQQLPAGTYEGLRLFLSEGTSVRGVLKSNSQAIVVQFREGPFGRREFTLAEEFDVEEGADNEILVHVDLRRSLKKNSSGGYELLPLTHVVPSRLAARLVGSVADSSVSRICAYNVGGKRRPEGRQMRIGADPGGGGKRGPGSDGLRMIGTVLDPLADARMRGGPGLGDGPGPGGEGDRGSKPPPGQPDATSSCDNAEAVSDVKDGRYDLRYLPPVKFILRLFKSNGSYSDVTVSDALVPQESRTLDL